MFYLKGMAPIRSAMSFVGSQTWAEKFSKIVNALADVRPPI